jgi:L-cysteate sulfo-lyase
VLAYGRAAAAMLDRPFDDSTKSRSWPGHAGPAYGVPHAATIEADQASPRGWKR